MSRTVILKYENRLDGFGAPDGEFTMQSDLVLPDRTRKMLKIISASVPSVMPNVFTTSDFSNAILRVSKDGGTNWTTITLPNGVYTVPYVHSAIVQSVPTWFTDVTDPAIALDINKASQIVYVKLDSSKLAAAGQVCVDFSVSRIWELLGFADAAARTFTADGIYEASAQAQFDWYGNEVNIAIDGLGSLCVVNGARSNIACSIPLSVTTVTNAYLFPTSSIVSDEVPIDTIDRIHSLRFYFTGSRIDSATGKQRKLYLLEGETNVKFAIYF